jgi:hypothetical protein
MPVYWKKWSIPLALSSLIATGIAFHQWDNDASHAEPGNTGLLAKFSDAVQIAADTAQFMPGAADFELYASRLKINAQKAPYGLPENVFIITRQDMVRIEATVRHRLENVSTLDLLKPLLSEYEEIIKAIDEQGIDQVFDTQALEGWRDRLIGYYIFTHQAGFVEYAYRQAGYGTDSKTTLDFFKTFLDLSGVPPLPHALIAKLEAHGMPREDMELLNIVSFMFGSTPKSMRVEDLDAEKIGSLIQAVKEMETELNAYFAGMDENMLRKMIGDTLLSLEARNYAMASSASGGIMEILSPNVFKDPAKHDGSVLIGNDATQSDGHFIQSALALDPRKIHPDLLRLSYLPAFINFHEVGHHIMGTREELAEQYGALKFMQEQPQNAGALRMMQDFRSLYLLVSDNPASLMVYEHTGKSLAHVMSLDPAHIARLGDADIVIAAREEHEPDQIPGQIIRINPRTFQHDRDFDSTFSEILHIEEVKRQFGQIKEIRRQLALRVALFEEYLRQESKTALNEGSSVARYYLASNKVFLAVSEYWSQDDASFEGMLKNETMASVLNIQRDEFEEDLDPAVLEEAIAALFATYNPGSPEHKILSDAEKALKNLSDPARSYNLACNFEPAQGWSDPVLSLGWNPLTQEVEYDGLAPIRRELSRLNSSLTIFQDPSISFERAPSFDIEQF